MIGSSLYSLFATLRLLIFISFWANFEPDKQMVDICQGGIVPREGGENRPLCVKDPFIRVRVSVASLEALLVLT